jgi:hypothetical protein
MRIGMLIRITLYRIAKGWRQRYWLLQMKLSNGLYDLNRTVRAWLHSHWPVSLSVYETEPMTERNPWLTATATLQLVTRTDMNDLLIGGVNENYAAFYELDHLAAWFRDHGVPDSDPVWGHMINLAAAESNQ